MRDNEDFGACVCALVDISRDDPDGLRGIDEFEICAIVIDRLAQLRVTIPAEHMLELIENSPYPDKLLLLLPGAYRCLRRLRRVALLLPGRDFPYEPHTLAEFGGSYWEAAGRDYAKRNDWHGGWLAIQFALLGERAFHNAVDWVFLPDGATEPVGLPCPHESGRRMLEGLHAAMCTKGLIPDVFEHKVSRWKNHPDWPAGNRVARELDPGSRKHPTLHGSQALAIGGWCNTNRRPDSAELDQIAA